MSTYDDDQKRNIIMEYYLHPKFKLEKVDKKNNTAYIHSTNCVDEIYLDIIKLDDMWVDFDYEARGCAVFLSSIEMFLELIKDKKILEIRRIALLYQKMLNQEEGDYSSLGKLQVFENVKNNYNRYECAKLISDLILKEIELILK